MADSSFGLSQIATKLDTKMITGWSMHYDLAHPGYTALIRQPRLADAP
jgi:hypothetical protein